MQSTIKILSSKSANPSWLPLGLVGFYSGTLGSYPQQDALNWRLSEVHERVEIYEIVQDVQRKLKLLNLRFESSKNAALISRFIFLKHFCSWPQVFRRIKTFRPHWVREKIFFPFRFKAETGLNYAEIKNSIRSTTKSTLISWSVRRGSFLRHSDERHWQNTRHKSTACRKPLVLILVLWFHRLSDRCVMLSPPW